MRFLRLLYLLLAVIGLQCEDDAPPVPDLLDKTGLLGKWEIEDETINGISDLLPKCCRFFEFMPDNQKDDLIGLFQFTDETGEYPGIFTVDQANQQIVFQREGRSPVVYDFTINSTQDYLTFSFTEGEDSNHIQGWGKLN